MWWKLNKSSAETVGFWQGENEHVQWLVYDWWVGNLGESFAEECEPSDLSDRQPWQIRKQTAEINKNKLKNNVELKVKSEKAALKLAMIEHVKT